MTDTESEKAAFACAIGMAILNLNEAEAEIFGLMESIAGRDLPLKIEAKYLRDKLNCLEALARRIDDVETRQRVLKLAEDARRLNDERNNFAHSLLWKDMFSGTQQRRWVRQKTKQETHDYRTPDEIMGVAQEFEALGDEAGALAAHIRVQR